MTVRKETIATMEGPSREPVTGLVDSLYWWLIRQLLGPGRPVLDLQREPREPEAGI